MQNTSRLINGREPSQLLEPVLDLSSRSFKTQDNIFEMFGDACLMSQDEEGEGGVLFIWILTSLQSHRATSGRERERERVRQTDRQTETETERERE